MRKICIYCGQEKSSDNFSSLEHAIPQSLGGSYAPDKFKTRDACNDCNHNLGLFVDAAFERNWVVSNQLRHSAFAFFDPTKPQALPLICMGNTSISPPEICEDEVCESWLGPLGEQIYWIRPKDEDLYWYIGGNPRTTKKRESRAYFLFTERSTKNPQLTWLSFQEAFNKYKPVKKIMCTKVLGANPADIGFSSPDKLDEDRIKYFLEYGNAGPKMNNIPMNMLFDHRFLAKLALGIGYCLFGKKALESEYGKELRNGLWYRESPNESPVIPQIRGTTLLGHEQDDSLTKFLGEPYAVSLIIMPSPPKGIAVKLNIGKESSWTVMCASYEGLEKSDLDYLGSGKALLLYKHLKKGFCLDLPDFLAYKLGHLHHAELSAINEQMTKQEGYFRNL